MFIVTPIVGVCNCSRFCCTLLYVHSRFALICLSSWCLVIDVWLFVTTWACLQFVIVVFSGLTHFEIILMGKRELVALLGLSS